MKLYPVYKCTELVTKKTHMCFVSLYSPNYPWMDFKIKALLSVLIVLVAGQMIHSSLYCSYK